MASLYRMSPFERRLLEFAANWRAEHGVEPGMCEICGTHANELVFGEELPLEVCGDCERTLRAWFQDFIFDHAGPLLPALKKALAGTDDSDYELRAKLFQLVVALEGGPRIQDA